MARQNNYKKEYDPILLTNYMSVALANIKLMLAH